MQDVTPRRVKGTQVRVKPVTRRKLEAIRRAKRWTFTETIDVAADEIMEREGIHLPTADAPKGKREKPKPGPAMS